MMKMFRNIRYALMCAAVLCAVGCGQEVIDIEAPGPEDPEEVLCAVRFRVEGMEDGPGTKATGAVAESAVNRAVFYLFRSIDTQNVYRRVADSETVYIESGDYMVYAVVNYPTSGASAFVPAIYATRSALDGYVSYLSDNSLSNFVMAGTKDVTISGSGTVNASATRLVAKIGVEKITVDFPAQYSGSTFTLRRIYATNVYSRAPLGGDYTYAQLDGTASYWYNREGYAASAVDALVYDAGINYAMALNAKRTYSTPHYFYVYPNATKLGEDSKAPTWGKRCTRFVIEAEVDGNTYSFPVTVALAGKGVLRNNRYVASEITITGLSSEEVSTEWKVYVNDWDGTDTVNETS